MEMTFSIFLFIVIVGTLPSLAWLFYFLRKDNHPEPKRVILQLFLIGFLLPPFVGIAEVFLQESVSVISQTLSLQLLLFLIAAFWEEAAKYLAARSIFHHEKEFDELTDGMIYLITVALGFAASENIIHALSGFIEGGSSPLITSLRVIALRAVGATLLHVLASGALGYFLARRIFLRERFGLVKGFIAATLIHTVFNWLLFLQGPLEQSSSPLLQPFHLVLLVVMVLMGGLIRILHGFSNLKSYDR